MTEFDDWLVDAVEAGRTDDLLAYRTVAPYGIHNHPTEDHILPLFAALGASSTGFGKALHRSFTYGILSMTAFAFD